MYLNHFSLKIKPFQITADPKFLWLGEKHKEALATLRYGIIDNRGFLLLTGEVGTGKTILINRLITLTNMDSVVATLPDPDLESMDFYNLLADGFNMKRKFESKGDFLIHLRDFLHQSHANKQKVLLIIDESQRLNHRLMEDIRVLSNIELYDKKLINIFFVGQQEFNSILMTPQNRALSQRITVRYHIEALNENETGEYIHHRLKVAGNQKRIFKKPAISEVFKVSGGVPRLINIVCDHAMLTGYAKGVKTIDGEIIRECAEELRIPIQKPKVDAATVRTVNTSIKEEDLRQKTTPSDGAEIKRSGKTSKAESDPKEKPHAAWRLAYAAVIIMLIGGIAFFISKYSGAPTQRYNEDDLTPQKYKTTLEQEKAKLEDRLSAGEEDTNSERGPVGNDKIDDSNVSATKPSKNGDATESVLSSKDEDSLQQEDIALPVQKNGEGKTEIIISKEAVQTIKPLPIMKEKINIQFDINSNEIDNTSYATLDKIAAYLMNHPEVRVFVRGYTDSSGSPGYNESVSRFRANAVKSYLIGKGAYPKNIEVFAMGADNPIASNNTLEGRKRNRRVEIEFQQ
jgi:general secretion pathway protein A